MTRSLLWAILVEMTTDAQKQEIIRLRKEGKSIREIAKLTGVSGSNVGYYAASVELTDDQKETLRNKNPALNPAVLSHRTKKDALATRLGYQEKGAEKIRNNDSMFRDLCLLYWAEGNKNPNNLGFINSDAEMLQLFYNGLKKHFPEDLAKLRLTVHWHGTNTEVKTETELKSYWHAKLGILVDRIDIRVINPSKTSKQLKKNKHLYGMGRLGLCSTKVVQTIFGGIQEIGGFKREGWIQKKFVPRKKPYAPAVQARSHKYKGELEQGLTVE